MFLLPEVLGGMLWSPGPSRAGINKLSAFYLGCNGSLGSTVLGPVGLEKPIIMVGACKCNYYDPIKG